MSRGGLSSVSRRVVCDKVRVRIVAGRTFLKWSNRGEVVHGCRIDFLRLLKLSEQARVPWLEEIHLLELHYERVALARTVGVASLPWFRTILFTLQKMTGIYQSKNCVQPLQRAMGLSGVYFSMHELGIYEISLGEALVFSNTARK